ncbi:alanine racemase C-terminal domain-containing protein [Escherichia coli]
MLRAMNRRIGVVAAGTPTVYPRHTPTGTPVLVDGISTVTVSPVSMDMLAVDLTLCRVVRRLSSVGKEIKIDDAPPLRNGGL